MDTSLSLSMTKIYRYDKTSQYDKIYQYDKKDKTNLPANFSLFFCEFYNFARKLK